MIKKSGSAKWTGNLKEGKGHVSTQTGVISDQPYGFNTRFEGKDGTNPEELIGAAHASCFSMALSMILEDYDLIADNPKILMGFSDITGILTAIHHKTGMVGFHGSILRQSFSEYTLSEFKKVVVHPTSRTSIAAPPPFETGEGRVNAANRMTRIAGGTARGPLLGGNLSLICSLMGTEYEPDFRGRILFLEDVNEAPYRIDRMLTQLRLADKLNQVAGIAFGKFTKTETDGNSFSIEEVLKDRCSDLGIPVVRGFMIGHVADRTVVPIGIEAELNADDATLTLLDTAVV